MLAATIMRGAPEVIWALALLTLGLPAYVVFRRIYSSRSICAGVDRAKGVSGHVRTFTAWRVLL